MPMTLSPRTSTQRNAQLQYCVGWVKRRAALYFDFLQQHSPKERAFLLMGFVEKGNPEEPTLVDITCLNVNDLKQNDPPIRPLEQAVESYNMQNEFVAWIVLEREDRSSRCDPLFTHVLTVALSDVSHPTPPIPHREEEKLWNRRGRGDEGRQRQIEFEAVISGMQNELERRLTQIETQLKGEKNMKDKITTLEGAVANAEKENKLCNERIVELTGHVNQYRSELSNISSGVVSEIKVMTEMMKGTEQLLHDSRSSQKHIETRQNQLLKDFGEARVGDQERDRRVERLCESLDSVRVEVQAFREQMRKLDKRCAASESSFDSLVPQVKKIDEVIGLISDQHDSQIRSVEESIRSASEKFEAEIPAQAILLESLQASVERTMTVLKKDLDTLHDWKREQCGTNELQLQRVDDHSMKLMQLESQLTDHANVFSQVEHLAQAAIRGTQDLHCSSMNVKQEIDTNRHALTTLDKCIHSLEERLNTTKRELLENIRSSHSIVKKEKDMELESIKTELKKTNSSLELIKSSDENSHTELAEMRQAVECVRESLRDHSHKVNDLTIQQESFSALSETIAQLVKSSEEPLKACQRLSDSFVQFQQTQHSHYQALAVLQQSQDEGAGHVVQLRHSYETRIMELQNSIEEHARAVSSLRSDVESCRNTCEDKTTSLEVQNSMNQFCTRIDKLESKIVEVVRWQSQSSAKCDAETIGKVQDFVNSEIQNFVSHLNEAMSKLDVTGLTAKVVDLLKRFEQLNTSVKQELSECQWQFGKQLQECRRESEDLKNVTRTEIQNINEKIGSHLNELQSAILRHNDVQSSCSAPTVTVGQYHQGISAPPTPTREYCIPHQNGKALTPLPVYQLSQPTAAPLPIFQPPPLPSTEPNIPPMLPAAPPVSLPPTPPPTHLSLLNQLPIFSQPSGPPTATDNLYRPRTPISNAALDINKSPLHKHTPAPNPGTPRRPSSSVAHPVSRDELYTSLIPNSMREGEGLPPDGYARVMNEPAKATSSTAAAPPLPTGRPLYQLHSEGQQPNGPSAFRTTLPNSLPSPAFTPYERVHQNGHSFLSNEVAHGTEKKLATTADFRNYEPPPRAVLNTSRTA